MPERQQRVLLILLNTKDIPSTTYPKFHKLYFIILTAKGVCQLAITICHIPAILVYGLTCLRLDLVVPLPNKNMELVKQMNKQVHIQLWDIDILKEIC